MACYAAWQPDPGAAYIDAFLLDWSMVKTVYMSSSTHTQIPRIGRHDSGVPGVEGAVLVSQALRHNSGEVGASSRLSIVAASTSNGQHLALLIFHAACGSGYCNHALIFMTFCDLHEIHPL